MLLKLILPITFYFLNMAMRKCKTTHGSLHLWLTFHIYWMVPYLLDGAGLEVSFIQSWVNNPGMGTAMCQNSLKLCLLNDSCFLFSYIFNSHMLGSKTTTRKWVLISCILMSHREKESPPSRRKIRSSIVMWV